MQNRIFILSLIFIFSAGLFAGDAGDRKKSNGKSAAAGKSNTSGKLNIEGAAAKGISFLNANGDTLMQVREDGQVIIGAAVANGNAVLDVDALNNDKGIMLPRLTRDERYAMSLTAADEGLLIYDETSSRFRYWNGSQWEVVGNNVGDNLGDHTVRQTLNLNGFYLSGDGDSEGIIIDDDGNILIGRAGTASNGAALTIEGRRRTKNAPLGSLNFENSDADDFDVPYTAAAIRSFNNGDSDDGDLRLYTAADSILTERMRITDEGNVGIGTTAPVSELEVAGTVTALSFAGDGSGLTNLPAGNVWQLTGNTGTDSTVNFIGTTDDQPLFFKANNQTILRLYDHAEAPNIIAGFSGNNISAERKGATISGGGNNYDPNSVSSNYATVSGGYGNTAGSVGAVIGGGIENTAGGFHATISGGDNNTTENNYAAVGGGRHNMASGSSATVPGGSHNVAGGDYSFAAGRRAIIADTHNGTFLYADQSNFDFNSATANEFAVRARGGIRFVTDIDASGNPVQTVNIDNTGTVSASAFVGDGSGLTGIIHDDLGNHTATQALDLANNNVVNGDTITANVFVGDGSGLTGILHDDLGNHTATQALDLANNNVVNGDTITANVFVGDGSGLTNMNGWQLTGNAGTGASDFIGTTDDQPLVFKANNQTILRLYDKSTSPNVIAGFSGNSFSGGAEGATISGGGSSAALNAVTSNYSTIGGGLGNQAGGNSGPYREYATVSGGGYNTASRAEATVSGGYENTASGGGATIGGGNNNNATANDATVSGGIQNTASGIASAVGGGFGNQATGDNSTISGGSENIVDGARSTIGGGRDNTASGFYATVPGGRLNSAAGEYSFASGRRAKIADTHDGTFLFSDQNDFDFNSAAANEFAVRATGGVRFVTAIDGAGNPTQTVGIDSDGNVGIGTTTPSSALDVGGGTISLNGGWLSGDGDNEGVFVDNSGNVGIGTSNPEKRLTISGSGWDNNTGGDLKVINSGALAAALTLQSTDTGGRTYSILSTGSNAAGGAGDFAIWDNTSQNYRFRIIGNGNVGIGTNNPGEKLHVKSTGANDAKIRIEGGASSDVMIQLQDNTGAAGVIGWDDSDGVIKLKAGVLSGPRGININPDNHVGIGTTNPIRAKVEIQGHAGVLPLNFGWLNNTGNTGTSSNGNGQYSLYASDRIAAEEFNAFSDARIKNIIGRSDNAQDLSTLLDIEITDYTMIDTVAKGSQSHKKVIAQQVKKVFPQAVSTMTDVVPDIYQLSEIADGWVQLATDLQVGEKVKLIRKDGNDIYAVQAVRDGAFRVDLAENGEVFVYGREVDDFHTVDYEAIAMLNVSATQALYQRMQQQQAAMNAQQEEIAALQEKVAKVDMLENQLAAIMQQLASDNAVKSAKLTDKNVAR